MDYRTCSEASTNSTSNRPKNYRKWSEKERYEIGKYAAINGSRAAERKSHTKEKPPSESNARRFSKLRKEEISKAQKNNSDVNRNLSVLPRGRPLLLGSLDQMVQRFLLSLQRTGWLVYSAVAISASKALIAQRRKRGKRGKKHSRAKNFIFTLREIKFAPNILQIRQLNDKTTSKILVCCNCILSLTRCWRNEFW